MWFLRNKFEKDRCRKLRLSGESVCNGFWGIILMNGGVFFLNLRKGFWLFKWKFSIFGKVSNEFYFYKLVFWVFSIRSLFFY